MKLAKIYLITNKINNMVYVGQTSFTIEKRWKEHVKESINRSKPDFLPMYDDMQEFGHENFSIEEIDQCLEHQKLIIEDYWITTYIKQGRAVYNRVRTNIKNPSRAQKIAESRLNNNFDYQSESFKHKMSLVNSGENNGMYGRKGRDAVNGQVVYAMNENREVAHEFVSVREALKFLGLKGHAALNNACKTGEKYKNYYWVKEWRKN